MHTAIADKQEKLAELCRHYAVVRLEVFDSAAHGTDFDPLTSDADFLVEFRRINGQASLEQYFDFAEALRRALGRPVDLRSYTKGANHEHYPASDLAVRLLRERHR